MACSQPCHPNTVFLQTGHCPCRQWVGPQRVVRSRARLSWSSCCPLPHQPPLLATHWRAHEGKGNNGFSRPSQPCRPHHQGRRGEKKLLRKSKPKKNPQFVLSWILFYMMPTMCITSMLQPNPKPKLSENWRGGVLKGAESIHHSTPTGKLHIVCNDHNMEGLGEARGCQEET